MSGDSVDATAPTKSADEVIHGSQSFWPVVGTITENISVHRELGGDGAGGSSWPIRYPGGESPEGASRFGRHPPHLE